MTSHRMQMRVFHTLAAVALSLAALILGGYFFGITVEQPYLRYQNVPFPVITRTVRAGEPVRLMVARCNDDSVRHGYLVTHMLRNLDTGGFVLLPDVWVEIAPGCATAISQLNIVPPGTPPGTYEASGRALVDGRFANHQVMWRSEPFEVVKGESP
jgi:hypothetical protein